ncbi:hypothetical protein [Bacillus sp. AFS017336]|uniref:hypothetical protein n=1 Tax=Bacillus sp. AFS017336 TaxID=2033489 RepID=UPI000BF1D2D5|nr:hypothetical protein [Bacillus sp. AFS017336]PEK98183.1 hypothetical protein CN601_26090 [Bacillus sp. AFS017336]
MKNKGILKIGLALQICLLVTTGCSSINDVSNKEIRKVSDEEISKNTKNGDFEIIVNSPKTVARGQIFTIDSTLNYLGEKEFDLNHSIGFFRYIVTDKYGKEIDTHIPIRVDDDVKVDFYSETRPLGFTKVNKGFTFSKYSFFNLKKKGNYKITAIARYSDKDIQAYKELKIADLNLTVN